MPLASTTVDMLSGWVSVASREPDTNVLALCSPLAGTVHSSVVGERTFRGGMSQMRPIHCSVAKALDGSSPARIRAGREENQNMVHVTPGSHVPASTALFIGAGRPAQVGSLKLI